MNILGDNLENIGKGSVLTESDADYIRNISAHLYDIGWYTKAIYLNSLVQNAEVKNGKDSKED